MGTNQNAIVVFSNPEFGEIRTAGTYDNPLFCALDVCRALKYVNGRDAIASHVDEDDVVKRDAIDSLGRTQLTTFVNESGLYALIFGSKMEDALRFKRWVTSEVLPSIRKTGGYGIQPPKSNIERIKDGYIALLEENVSLTEKNAKLVKRLESVNAEKRLLQAKLDRREERKQLQLEAPKYFTQFLKQTDLFNEQNKRVPFDEVWAAFNAFYLGLGLSTPPTPRSFGLYLTNQTDLEKGRSADGIYYYRQI